MCHIQSLMCLCNLALHMHVVSGCQPFKLNRSICFYNPVLRASPFWLAIIGLCFGQLFRLGPNLLTLFYVKYSCIVLYSILHQLVITCLEQVSNT